MIWHYRYFLIFFILFFKLSSKFLLIFFVEVCFNLQLEDWYEIFYGDQASVLNLPIVHTYLRYRLLFDDLSCFYMLTFLDSWRVWICMFFGDRLLLTVLGEVARWTGVILALLKSGSGLGKLLCCFLCWDLEWCSLGMGW